MQIADDISQKKICVKCMKDPHLVKEVKAKGNKIKCSYCQYKAIGYPFADFANRVAEAFLENFERSGNDDSDYGYYKYLSDEDFSPIWNENGETVADILEDQIGFSYEVSKDLADYLEENYDDPYSGEGAEDPYFSSGLLYETKGFSDEKWQDEWEKFEHILKGQSRYFNEQVNDYLNRVFKNIEYLQTNDDSSLITLAGPGREISKLYRARVFQSHGKLMEALMRPDQDLGPPPSELASAGRMNARGIPVFYGATSEQVALAEVRPPVGSNVAVAKFDITKEVRLLNLPAFGSIRTRFQGSIFDPEYVPNLERAVFLTNLGLRMIMPVMPDHEVFEYLPTQVIADYLSSRKDLNCDGIIFPSMQVPGKALNVVLFNKASKVEQILLPPGTTLKAESDITGLEEPGDVPDINIIENHLKIDEEELRKLGAEEFILGLQNDDQISKVYGQRVITLKIDPNSIVVNLVTGVEFQLVPRAVNRLSLS